MSRQDVKIENQRGHHHGRRNNLPGRDSYGVVGLAPKNLADGIVRSITREPSRGVTVEYNGEDIDIEVHIIVEYGTRINSVAKSVANTVRFHVEKALGLRVNKIDVHVAGL